MPERKVTVASPKRDSAPFIIGGSLLLAGALYYMYREGLLPFIPPECKPGEEKCKNTDLYRCIRGRWKLVERNSPKCITPECVEGEEKCENTDLYRCIKGKWELVERNSPKCEVPPPPPETVTVTGRAVETRGGIVFGSLPGAVITAKNTDTGFTKVAITDSKGEYRLEDMPTGYYDFEGKKEGYCTFLYYGVDLRTPGTYTLPDLPLEKIIHEEIKFRSPVAIYEKSWTFDPPIYIDRIRGKVTLEVGHTMFASGALDIWVYTKDTSERVVHKGWFNPAPQIMEEDVEKVFKARLVTKIKVWAGEWLLGYKWPALRGVDLILDQTSPCL